MSDRVTLDRAARMASMSLSRGTVRSVEDNHLVQEAKEIDVFHSETASNSGAPLERWQMIGFTAVPLKQKQDQSQQSQSSSQDDGMNHDQPTGESAEAIMLYLNGSRSHPVALIDDRRVRPYNMKEGESAHYAADGSEQMVFFNANGAHLISRDGKDYNGTDGTRYASLRHVNKSGQSRKPDTNAKPGDYKHEGETVNTEVRATASRIEFLDGDNVVGYYDKGSQTWYFKGKIATMEFDTSVTMKAPTISAQVTARFETVGQTYLGVDSAGDSSNVLNVKLIDDSPAKQTFAKKA
jgi:phage gp45-like